MALANQCQSSGLILMTGDSQFSTSLGCVVPADRVTSSRQLEIFSKQAIRYDYRHRWHEPHDVVIE